MRVYVNWETQEVVGPNQIEAFIDQKLSDYLEGDELLEIYLEERYTLSAIWYMDDEQRESVMEDYAAYQREYVEKQFDNEFCEYEIE